MVKLNKIYTRTGDEGTTGLAGGERVTKHSLRVAAFGDIDELNAILGLVRTLSDESLSPQLSYIQNDLFDLGADIARPQNKEIDKALRITADQVARLEQDIDRANSSLAPLTSFILPGGSQLSAWLHLARVVARRAERQLCHLAAEEPVNKFACHYINRLSDLLFVLARAANDGGTADILWEPGKHRKSVDENNESPLHKP